MVIMLQRQTKYNCESYPSQGIFDDVLHEIHQFNSKDTEKKVFKNVQPGTGLMKLNPHDDNKWEEANQLLKKVDYLYIYKYLLFERNGYVLVNITND